jgi:anti-sigma factor RsiW
MAHLDYDVLADLAEGLLDDEFAGSVQAHLADCAECRARSEDLVSVSELLAAAPMPMMPPDLALRLDKLVLAEAEKGSVSDLAARRRMRSVRFMSVAAAVLVVTGGGLAGHALLTSETQKNSAAVVQAPVQEKAAGQSDSALNRSQLSVHSVESKTDYRKATLAGQVTEQIQAGDSRSMSVAPSAQLIGCVQLVSGGSRTLLVDQAQYEGQPATIIVVSPGSGPNVIWVVGPKCSANDRDEKMHQQIPA